MNDHQNDCLSSSSLHPTLTTADINSVKNLHCVVNYQQPNEQRYYRHDSRLHDNHHHHQQHNYQCHRRCRQRYGNKHTQPGPHLCLIFVSDTTACTFSSVTTTYRIIIIIIIITIMIINLQNLIVSVIIAAGTDD